jgi:hypothetical protein
MAANNQAIRFPLFHTPEIAVEFFPDELPEDHYDLIDCLRLELAPLKIWKTCAVSKFVLQIIFSADKFI